MIRVFRLCFSPIFSLILSSARFRFVLLHCQWHKIISIVDLLKCYDHERFFSFPLFFFGFWIDDRPSSSSFSFISNHNYANEPKKKRNNDIKKKINSKTKDDHTFHVSAHRIDFNILNSEMEGVKDNMMFDFV